MLLFKPLAIILLDHIEYKKQKTFLLGVVIIVHAETLCTIFTLHRTETKIQNPKHCYPFPRAPNSYPEIFPVCPLFHS